MRRGGKSMFSQLVFRLRERTGMSWEEAQRALVLRSARKRHAAAVYRRRVTGVRRWWED